MRYAPLILFPSGQKKSPSRGLGLQSLIAVNTVRHLLREEKQGMNALRRIIR
jgi:hypothetical protein